MRFGSLVICLPLVAVPMTLLSGLAIAADDLCFMQPSSGQRISLDRICGKPGDNKMRNFMWDEHNYDSSFVTKTERGWSILLGGAYPFKHPDGGITWPDGRVTTAENLTARPIVDTKGKIVSVQYYKEDRSTPLQVGETLTMPDGMSVTQEKLN